MLPIAYLLCLASNFGTCFHRFDCIIQSLATKSDHISMEWGQDLEAQDGSCSGDSEDGPGFLFLKYTCISNTLGNLTELTTVANLLFSSAFFSPNLPST